MAVLDAFSYNMCIVSTNVGGLKDILIDNKNSLLFKPGDINSLYMKLKNILSNKELRMKLRKNGMELTRDFSSKKYNKNLSSIYYELLK